MRSDAQESSGRGRRGSQVVARWVSVERAAALLDVSAQTVRRYEREGLFGAGNSLSLPGGDVRIRARAVNRFAEACAAQREAMRAKAAAATLGRLERAEVVG